MKSFADLGIGGGGISLPDGWEEVDKVPFADLIGDKVEVHGFGQIDSAEYPGKPYAIIAVVVEGQKFRTATGSGPINDQLVRVRDADGFPFVASVEERPGKRQGTTYLTFA